MKVRYKFSNSAVDYYFADGMSHLKKITDPGTTVIITDENVYGAHTKKFKGWNTIVLKAGEDQKNQSTVDNIIQELIELEADRKFTLVGVGGGVITDLTGYVASVYMRGIRFGFIPTSLLAMVDASIGGKNGIDVGVYKNMVGVIRQPAFILHDMIFLNSLPQAEWENGFAEIIKHACIRDATMFNQLEENSFRNWQGRKKSICDLIQRNAVLKTKIVQKDEFEKGDRRLLNFGHTLGHALEKEYTLSHGQAISIGMAFASNLSEKINGFKNAQKIISLLSQYNLPTQLRFDSTKVFEIMKMDKKKEKKELNYVLVEKIGKGIVLPIPLAQIQKLLK